MSKAKRTPRVAMLERMEDPGGAYYVLRELTPPKGLRIQLRIQYPYIQDKTGTAFFESATEARSWAAANGWKVKP